MIELTEVLDGEYEILHLSKRMKLDGDVYDREISFLSDYQIFHRFAKNGNWGQGWSYWKLWGTLNEVTYHPAYIPGIKEFTKSLAF